MSWALIAEMFAIDLYSHCIPIHIAKDELGLRKSFVEDFPHLVSPCCCGRQRCCYRLFADELRWTGHLAPGWDRWYTGWQRDRQSQTDKSDLWWWGQRSYRNTDRSLGVQTCRNHTHKGWKWANQGQRLPAELPQSGRKCACMCVSVCVSCVAVLGFQISTGKTRCVSTRSAAPALMLQVIRLNWQLLLTLSHRVWSHITTLGATETWKYTPVLCQEGVNHLILQTTLESSHYY